MQLHISARIFGTINCSTHQLTQQGDCSRDTIWIICKNLKFRFVIKRKIWLVLLFMNVFRVKFHQEVPRVRAMCRGALRWSHLDSQRWIPFQYRSLWRTLHVWKTVSTLIFPFVLLDLLLLGYNEWEMLNFVWAKFKDIRHQLEPSTLMSHLVALHIFFLICLSSPVHGGRMFLAKVCG